MACVLADASLFCFSMRRSSFKSEDRGEISIYNHTDSLTNQ